MAWNGSDQTQPKSGKYRKAGGRAARTTAPSSPLRGLLAALIVVAGAAAVWWFFLRPAPPPAAAPSGEGKAGAIAEQKPEIVTNRPKPKAEKPKPTKPLTREEIRANARQKWRERYEAGELPPTPAFRTNEHGRIVKLGKAIAPRKDNTASFKHVSEAFISSIYTMDPTLGPSPISMPFPADFTEDLKACLDEPIEILPTDGEEQIAIKQAVGDAKEELKKLIAQGEDPAEIVRETKRELEAVARYREELKDQLREVVSNPDMKETDVEDFVKAANMMLEDKGIEPLKANPMMLRALRLRAVRKASYEAQE